MICRRCKETMNWLGGNSYTCMNCGLNAYKHGGGQVTYTDENGNPYYPKMQDERTEETSENNC